jgi:cytochrome P450
LQETARTHGPVVELRLGPGRTLLLSDPEGLEQVLLSDARHYTKDLFLQDLRRVVGNGLLTSEGDFWRRQRRLAQPAFHRQKIQGYGETMVALTEEALRPWGAGQLRDLRDEMMTLTLAIVGQTLFSSPTRAIAQRVGDAMEIVMERYTDPVALLVPSLVDYPLPGSLRFRRAAGELDRLVRGIIRDRQREATPREDLLAMLLDARDEDGSAMNEQQLRDEVITLFLAGHETTALALSWIFVLLSLHPAADARLRDELRRVLPDRSPSPADIPELPYTEAVVMETLRLYPPAWSLGREAAAPLQVQGYEVRTGDQMFLNVWSLHRDPRFFPEPERFLPERWLDGLAKKLPRFAYAPFGGGPRQCIGNAFAMMEATLLLATIARRFRLELLPGQNLDPLPSITLRPRGALRVRLHRREVASS